MQNEADTAASEGVRWQDLPATVLAHLLKLAPYKRAQAKQVCQEWRLGVNESLHTVTLSERDLELLHTLKAVQHLTARGVQTSASASSTVTAAASSSSSSSSNPWFTACPSTLQRLKVLTLQDCPTAFSQLAEWQLAQAAAASQCCAPSSSHSGAETEDDDNNSSSSRGGGDSSSRPGLEALQELTLSYLGDISDSLPAVLVCQAAAAAAALGSSSRCSKLWPLFNLRQLSISGCSFSNSEPGHALDVLQQLPVLCSLELSGCGLRELPAAVGACTALTKLDLYANHLLTLPDDFSSLQHLQVLNLSDNLYLESLGSGFSGLSSLSSLNLTGPNCLFRDNARHPLTPPPCQQPQQQSQQQVHSTSNASNPTAAAGDEHVLSHEQQLELLPELALLSSLRELWLSHNRDMRVLPLAVCRLTALRLLDAVDCSLRYLNDELWECRELRALLLGDNVLADVPEEVGQLQKLQELDLGCRTLWRLPQALLGLTALRRLVLWTMAVGQDVAEQLQLRSPNPVEIDFCEEPDFHGNPHWAYEAQGEEEYEAY